MQCTAPSSCSLCFRGIRCRSLKMRSMCFAAFCLVPQTLAQDFCKRAGLDTLACIVAPSVKHNRIIPRPSLAHAHKFFPKCLARAFLSNTLYFFGQNFSHLRIIPQASKRQGVGEGGG